MSSITIQLNDNIKKLFDNICVHSGVSEENALKRYILATVNSGRLIPLPEADGIPEEVSLEDVQQALKEIRQEAIENGTADMSMEEIDAEIQRYRQEKQRQNGNRTGH